MWGLGTAHTPTYIPVFDLNSSIDSYVSTYHRTACGWVRFGLRFRVIMTTYFKTTIMNLEWRTALIWYGGFHVIIRA
jgi:hypothetical protein